jgi:hypothetical protein
VEQFMGKHAGTTAVGRVIKAGAAVFLAGCITHPAGAQQWNYLQALKQAETAAEGLPLGAPRSPETDEVLGKANRQLDPLGTRRMFAGDQQGALLAHDAMMRSFWKKEGPASAAELKLIDEATVEDAVKAIVEQARTKRVVLLNEEHMSSMNRAFSQRVARELRKIGYQYLACETFTVSDRALFTHGDVRSRDGYYTNDPTFGNWINEAIADGWKLVPYEVGHDPAIPAAERFRWREEGQARNLVERIFARDKDARVLIHVGRSHLNKSANATEPAFMGEYLRRMTGLDMLHVDQLRFYEHPDPEDENPLYRHLLAKSGSTAPFVLKNKDGSNLLLRGLAGRVDMLVVFPRYGMRDGRPGWMTSLAGREPRDIPPSLLPTSGRRLIKAYRAGAPDDAVPADVVLVEANKPVPKLMLPKGEYRYSFEE